RRAPSVSGWWWPPRRCHSAATSSRARYPYTGRRADAVRLTSGYYRSSFNLVTETRFPISNQGGQVRVSHRFSIITALLAVLVLAGLAALVGRSPSQASPRATQAQV